MYEYRLKLIRSNRKTILLKIDRDLSVTVNAPRYISKTELDRFIESKSGWIQKHLELAKRARAESESINFNSQMLSELKKQASAVLPERVGYYAEVLNVKYSKLTVRLNISNWGSCSSKGNLNFNALLMLMPPEVIDYVVVHELCHRLFMNHSPKFWSAVSTVLPDCDRSRKYLAENGGKYITALRNFKQTEQLKM